MNTHGATVNRDEIVSMYAGLKASSARKQLGTKNSKSKESIRESRGA